MPIAITRTIPITKPKMAAAPPDCKPRKMIKNIGKVRTAKINPKLK
jgi:hypothetical protein